MTLAYLGPGIGIGGLVVLLGIAVAVLFVVYSFVFLPITSALRKRKRGPQDKANSGK
jgi:hypothetical protein